MKQGCKQNGDGVTCIVLCLYDTACIFSLVLTLTVLVMTIDALQHFETG